MLNFLLGAFAGAAVVAVVALIVTIVLVNR